VHFVPLRQVYYAVLLATWYRESIAAKGYHTALFEKAKLHVNPLDDNSDIGTGVDSPDWLNQCYKSYLELVDGVFRDSRPDPRNPDRIRVYQSGGIVVV